jgi:hypothetical protein
VRRGAAWPAERPSSWLVVREAVSAGRWPTAEPSWLPSAAGAVHRNTGGVAQRARAGHGGPGGADAGRAFVGVPVSWASVRSPLSGAGVQHHACLSTRLLSGVRCGCLGVQMSGVRCPAWVSGVRGFPRPLCPAGRLWRGGGGQAAAWLGWPASAWSPAVSTASSSSARVGAWRSSPGAGCAGPAEGSAWTWPSSWAVVGSWLGRARGRPGLAGCAGGSSVGWRAGVPSEAATTLRGHRVRTRAEPPGRGEPSGLDCDLRVRPWCGRSLQ